MRTSVQLLFALLSFVWSVCSWAAPIFDVIDMGSTAERRYVDLNDSTHALVMRQASNAAPEIVIEDWSHHGQHYSEFRPGVMTGAAQVEATAFNNAGEIVGDAYLSDASGNTVVHAFLYRRGHFIDLQQLAGMSNASSSAANAINDHGDVVGTYSDTSGVDRSFLYRRGRTTSIADANAADVYAEAINNRREIAGTFIPPTPAGSVPYARLFSYENNQLTDLGRVYNMPGTSITVNGINDRGQIIGAERYSNHGADCFIYSNGVRQSIGSAECSINDINDPGIAVGAAPFDPSLANRAFIYIDGAKVELQTLINPTYLAQNDLRLTGALLINDQNQIIATGNIGGASPDHYYLLTPRRGSK